MLLKKFQTEDEFVDAKEDSPEHFDSVLGDCLLFQGRKMIYTPQVLTFINNIEVWENNRPLDEKHINDILAGWEEEYGRTKDVTIFGSIVVTNDENGKKIVVDGQHRVECLKRFYKKYKTFGKVRFSVEFISRDFQTEDDLFDLFQKLNNLKPQTKNLRASLKKSKLIIELIKKKYGTDIIREGKVNRPRVSSKRLKDSIKKHMKEVPLEDISCKLDELNDKFRDLSDRKIFGREYEKNEMGCFKIREKAVDLDFYLAMRKPNGSGILIWS